MFIFRLIVKIIVWIACVGLVALVTRIIAPIAFSAIKYIVLAPVKIVKSLIKIFSF